MNLPQVGPILIMAGGTGGHVYPALAVAEELRARGRSVEWVGTSRGLEARVVPAAGFILHELSVRGVRGKNALDTLRGIGLVLAAGVQALKLVRQLRPACVVGLGGYVAGPAGVAAWLCRRPLLIHEQNAVAGTTNRLLAPLANTVAAGFRLAFDAKINAAVIGNPVRADLLAAGESAAYDYDGQRPLRLLVLGGSLGAQPINEVLPPTLARLRAEEKHRIEVWHQTGEAHAEVVSEAYGEMLQAGVRVAPFIENMARAYAWADLVICRAGALTVAELAVMGRPALLIPLPHAIDDHQTANAQMLVEAGGATLLRQSELSEEALAKVLRGYAAYPGRLQAMAGAARAAAMPEATARMADAVEALIDAE